MRRVHLLLIVMVVAALASPAALAASKLSSKLAKTRISALMDSKLVPDAIEIRRIVPQGDTAAIAETTVTLAFQFRKDDKGLWTVDAVRLGDLDWLAMSELMAAIYHGSPPALPSSATQLPPPVTPAHRFHTNPSEFEKERRAMIELGASPLIPPAIEIRRVISQTDVRAIVESTVSMSFLFRRQADDWQIAEARLEDKAWVQTSDVLATLNDGRRRVTLSRMETLAAAIDAYRTRNGALPPARDIVALTDVLHPTYMSELVRLDGWGQPIEYAVTGSEFRLTSGGADLRRNTADDVVLQRKMP
jgi:hypothetical protein